MKRAADTLARIAVASLLGTWTAQSAPSPDQRAAEVEHRMTEEERIQLLHGIMPIPTAGLPPIPAGLKVTAGYIQGIPRLGIPGIYESDASLGIANPMHLRKDDISTALPASVSLAATFDPKLAFQVGQVLGNEASAKGFSVLLAPGINLTRDPRNGRTFEYLGEDPWLAGVLAAESIRGIQSQHVVATLKHYAVNDQETLRTSLDVHLDEKALRESDLLAFEIAIEKGGPGSIMCAYNLVNAAHACGSSFLLNEVLKHDWHYPGWVMSDWGAVHSVDDFANGLDQESDAFGDAQVYFDAPLKADVASGRISRERISDAVRRYLRSLYAVGADVPSSSASIDFSAHAKTARAEAAEGTVLLKNQDSLLPLSSALKHVVVIGGHADVGVISGAGSSQVVPAGSAMLLPVGSRGVRANGAVMLYMPSSPAQSLRQALPHTMVEFDPGYVPEEAAAVARGADVAIVFATQWRSEGQDASLSLPEGQDHLIEQVAAANPNTVVVLETGGAVTMPWLPAVKAVVEAWYPGQEGGPAIADVLTGQVNPSGHLPITFPRDETQLPRPSIPGLGQPDETPLSVKYTEGAKVGYRWYTQQTLQPLFPFGQGLSYTSFRFSTVKLAVRRGVAPGLSATFSVTNTGHRAGCAVPQLYLVSAAGRAEPRLVAFDRLRLAPGVTSNVTLEIDPRMIAEWDTAAHGWHVRGGEYRFALGQSAERLQSFASTQLADIRLAPPR